MAKTKYLVIVESPAKAKTIGKYLGPDYKVVASMGHLRDLPKSTMGVDIEGGFNPQYIPVKGREETISELKKAAKASEKVFLATDPDREGEAISWHLKELLGISDEDVYRVTFNEITKKVVETSIKNPRAIDEDLVDAQQARRILDRIVGYKLSPLLWKKVRRGLSAGRVQSVATRMVVDREDEIRNFVPKEYWHLDAYLNNGRSADFIARYYGFGGKKRELGSADEVNAVKSEVAGSPFIVKSVKRQDKSRTPAPPFITSTLQQEGSRKLGMTPKRTMSIAQQLYEGVDVEGEGTVGLITYMRTDSLRLSDEATAEARRLIIWNRFIASQMSAAVYDSVTADIESAGHIFRATSSTIKFSGFTAVYEEGRDDEADERETPIPDIKDGETLNLKKLTEEQKFTQPPARYTEATLVKAMEESGVGRPSTYAPTVSTILDREYVVKEGKSLRPTPLGEVVTKLMKDRFTDIVDVGFTAKMEGELDNVEKGEKPWKEVLSDFYGPFDTELTNAEKALEGEYIKIPAEESDEVCDVCGRKMVIKSGRFGRFLACPGYPECTFTKPIVIEMPGKCPKCGSRILKRTSKNGYTYYACERGQECGFMTWDVPVKDFCPSCGKTMFKKSGKGFNKAFCINEDCPNFLPEDKRGYRKKTASADKKTDETTTKTAKKTAKSTAAKTSGKKK